MVKSVEIHRHILTLITIEDKLVVRGGKTWCMDVLDVFVRAGQSISRGDQVIRSYRCVIFFLIFADLSLSIFRPALDNQESIILHIFSTEEESDTDIKVSFFRPL